MKIDRVEMHVVAPEVQKFTWSHDLPEQFVTNTMVHLYTDDGVEGVGSVANYTSFDFDHYTAETMRHMIPILIGADPLDRDTLWQSMLSRCFPQASGALAAIDIALWDLFGHLENQPIYKLLGGTRNRIQSYEYPLLDGVPAYIYLFDEFLAAGFRLSSFHAWCLPDKDLKLARVVREHHPGDDVSFMMDAENNYDHESSLRVAEELQELGFTWFEAPLPDYDLDGYRELTARRWLDVVDVAAIRCEIMSLRTGSDGIVEALSGPGIGLEIDWEAMRAATIHRSWQGQVGNTDRSRRGREDLSPPFAQLFSNDVGQT